MHSEKRKLVPIAPLKLDFAINYLEIHIPSITAFYAKLKWLSHAYFL